MIYKSLIGKDFELIEERKKHIFAFHPDVKPYLKHFKKVLLGPDEIKVSKRDKSILLFYRYFANIKGGKYIVIVGKINKRSFILTSYLTKRKLSGERYEKQK